LAVEPSVRHGIKIHVWLLTLRVVTTSKASYHIFILK